jgi:HEAT repeat protein
MDRKHTKLLKAVVVVWLGLLIVSAVNDWLTAESRFYAKLDAELWKLRAPGADRVQLSPIERERYRALLRCNDPSSRWQAAADLGRWQDKASVFPLVAAMQDDDGTQKTCRIAQSLGAIGDSNAVPALLQAIHHPRNLDLRVCATHALAEIGDARAVGPLIAKAENAGLPEDDRVSAMLGLGHLAHSEAAPALHRIAASDSDERFRTIAAAALRQIELMQNIDPVPALAEELNSPAHWVQRAWLIQKLGEKWDSRAAEALNRFLRRSDGWTSDRIRATALLLHRRCLGSDLLNELAASTVKENRWISRYALVFESKQNLDDDAVNSTLASAHGLPQLSQ